MTAELTSLTAKMDALRAKGFSDEEINTLLSPVAVAAQPNLLPLTDGDKAYAEQWNENIETIIEKDKKTWIPFLLLGVGAFVPEMFSATRFSTFATYWGISCYVLLFGFAFVSMYKQVDRAKFFVKKRVD
jgi:hypothetical protein